MTIPIDRPIDIRRVGALWLKSPAFARHEAQALEIIRRAFGQMAKPYCSISGGIDSVSMAALVAQVAHEMNRECPLWAHVSDASFPGTVEVLEQTAERVRLPLILDESPVSAFSVIGQQADRQFGKTGYFFTAIRNFMQAGGYDGAFVGVRAAESARRRAACRANGTLFTSNVPCPHINCYPMAWLTIDDVAAVIAKYDLPLHPIYDKVSVSDRRIRLGYVTALDLLPKGTAVFLRVNYPELFNRLAAAYPEVRAYV